MGGEGREGRGEEGKTGAAENYCDSVPDDLLEMMSQSASKSTENRGSHGAKIKSWI